MGVAEYYKQIVEASLDGVMQVDAAGHVAFTNRNGCRLLGIKEPAQSHEREWVTLCLNPRARVPERHCWVPGAASERSSPASHPA